MFAAARIPDADRDDAARAVAGAIRAGHARTPDELVAWVAEWRPNLLAAEVAA